MVEVPIQRRFILGGAGAAVALCVSGDAPMVAAAAPDLFAFRGCGIGNLVFAIVARAGVLQPSEATVTFHVGRRAWVVDASAPQGSGIYAEDMGGHTAAVLELPADYVRPGDSLNVWAEINTRGGKRTRVGGPFLAKVLVGHPALSRLYPRLNPCAGSGAFH